MVDVSMETVINNIDRWVYYLQTTTKLQTTSRLHDEYGYCCLGIACEVTPGFIERFDYNTSETEYSLDESDYSATVLPLDGHILLGLNRRDGARFSYGNFKKDKNDEVYNNIQNESSLADLNDREGYTFKQIANVLLVDLRTDELGFFRPDVRVAWRKHHGFTF